MYHNFTKYNNYQIRRGSLLENGYANNFKNQIKFLNNHFPFSYPDEFFNGNDTKATSVLITFDDGYLDNYTYAYPVLKKYAIPATIFLATDFISQKAWLWSNKLEFILKNSQDLTQNQKYNYCMSQRFFMKLYLKRISERI